ncbi:hypothetical protein QFZ82_007820 [Streptomyces sp. V4I23]|uniref:right-handed parallel beta-helix repeat-containing protein n=1 Tax=Streptomyces sp. V4I23 TaxID=3042282 RepID=UPI0027848A4F|nr:right-handed parallel beta-helix repeat-containing protein [Streptomyces sp. V4I23]MDQ1013335.1 hypothetical protein [Streptomyces sp. V4I23]
MSSSMTMKTAVVMTAVAVLGIAGCATSPSKAPTAADPTTRNPGQGSPPVMADSQTPSSSASPSPASQIGTPASATAPSSPSPSLGRHLYVAPSGSESNPGTKEMPVKTIAKASTLARPGTTVHVAAGTYPGDFVTNAAGSATARIRYISDTPWGARIVPPSVPTGRTIAWDNRGRYVDIVGFTVDGTSAADTKWANGIVTRAAYSRIMNNHVHHIANSSAYCDRMGGSGVNASNDSRDGTRAEHIDLLANVVHHIGPAGYCNKTHGVYMSVSGTLKNNVVYGIAGWGIHLWHDARNVDIVNNTVVRSQGGGILVAGGDATLPGGADYCRVMNNIVYGNRQGISEQGMYGTHNTYVNNLSQGAWMSGYDYSLGNPHSRDITGKPRFMDDAGGDYRLGTGSPGLDVGLSDLAPEEDVEGRPRPQGRAFDLGAYERPV